MRYRKIVITAMMVILVLIICGLIGQKIVLPRRMVSEGYVRQGEEMPNYLLLQNPGDLVMSGNERAADNGWGKNIGILDITSEKGKEKVLLMTPDTALTYRMKVSEKGMTLSFETEIYKDVTTDMSDGTSLILQVFEDGQDMPVIEEKISVFPEKQQYVKMDFLKVIGKEVTLCITCDPGENGDASYDFTFLKYIYLD